MNNIIDHKGKNVLVTGGGSGIGAGICESFAACGANILINYNSSKIKAEKLAQHLIDKYNIKAISFKADISQAEDIYRMFQEFDTKLGEINILVNNAGFENINHAIDLDIKDWDNVMNVNVRGAFICSQEAGKRMVENNKGVIINISSIHDKIARKGLVHYCASKAAMNMMTKCFALELAENNIRVLSVSPGAIETEMNREEINKFGRENFNGWIPLKRIGVIEDISWTCAFLASDKSAYCTGEVIYVDGAYKENTIQYDPRPKRK